MGGIVRVEDRNRQIVTIDDFDRAHDEGVLRRKEFMTALVTRGNLVEYTMTDEAAQDFAKRRNRSQRFGPVPARVDDLQALVASPLFGVRPPALSLLGRAAFRTVQEDSFAFPC